MGRMRNVVWISLLLIGAAGIAEAASTLVYGRDGKVRQVIRQAPSGPIVYDREGRLQSAVRGNGDGVGFTIELQEEAAPQRGSSLHRRGRLHGGVGDR